MVSNQHPPPPTTGNHTETLYLQLQPRRDIQNQGLVLVAAPAAAAAAAASTATATCEIEEDTQSFGTHGFSPGQMYRYILCGFGRLKLACQGPQRQHKIHPQPNPTPIVH